MKTLSSLLAVALLFTVTGAQCGDGPTTAEFNVDAQGGTVTLLDGAVTLVFPPGAVTSPVKITAAPGVGPAAPSLFPGTVFEIQPALTFAQPVSITVKYAGITPPTGVRSSEIGIYRVASAAWEKLSGIVVDSANKTVKGEISNATTVGILGAPVTAVAVSVASVTIQVGDSTLATAVVSGAGDVVLPDRAVTWSTSNSATATVNSAGWVKGVAEGAITVIATSETVSGNMGLTVVPKPTATGEPTFNAGQDTQHYSEGFEPYATVSALPYAKTEKFGSFAIDPTVVNSGARSLRIDWQNAGCLGNSDADVAIDKKVADTTSTHRNWFLRYFARFSPGYQFYWTTGSCTRGVGSKEVVIFRNSNNTGGRITWSAITPQAACPNIYGSALSGMRWHFSIDGEPGTTAPTQCSGSLNYRQHLALAEKGPTALADGNWHRITMQLRRESAKGAGDGLIRVWIDGTLIMDYDGEDAASPAFHQVFTRTMAIFNPIQYQSVINAGAPQLQSRWFDDFLLWSRP